ncbi:MAG: sigma-70 family RNA polymerase sigma factor [Planctomycetes bacterium]|nr:sigma-70 family RNA polymerase sigma factor [Planctomycetota bacterium]MBI3845383.1 sigma-70 family RNA polymerase sigma factor [Planctomycetota bacterium]
MKGYEDPDLELVLRCQENRGRPEGVRHLDSLLRRYHEPVARWCLRILGDREDAADCVQEVLWRICRGIGGFQADGSFASWVYSLTRKACATALARRSRRETMETRLPSWITEIPSPVPQPLVALADAESRIVFNAMLAGRITPIESDVLFLHHVEGLSMRAITELLGLSNPSGAKAFLASAKRKLRERLSTARLGAIGFDPPNEDDRRRLVDEGLE